MSPTVTVVLRQQAEDCGWVLLRDGERMGEGAAADGDAALAAARSRLEAFLDAGLEAELCGPHWRRSSIRVQPEP